MRKHLLFAFALLVSPAFAQIVNLQSRALWNNSLATCTTPSMNVGSGHLIAVWTSWQTSGPNNVTAIVGDSLHNTPFLSAVGPTLQSASNTAGQIFYLKSVVNTGSDTITVTFNSTTISSNCVAVEYSGLDSNYPLDSVSAGYGSGLGTYLDSGTSAPANANLAVFGAALTSSGSIVAGADFTAFQTDPMGRGIVEQPMIFPTTDNRALWRATATAASGNWLAQMAVFRDASGIVAGGWSPTRPPQVINASQYPGTDPCIQVQNAEAANNGANVTLPLIGAGELAQIPCSVSPVGNFGGGVLTLTNVGNGNNVVLAINSPIIMPTATTLQAPPQRAGDSQTGNGSGVILAASPTFGVAAAKRIFPNTGVAGCGSGGTACTITIATEGSTAGCYRATVPDPGYLYEVRGTEPGLQFSGFVNGTGSAQGASFLNSGSQKRVLAGNGDKTQINAVTVGTTGGGGMGYAVNDLLSVNQPPAYQGIVKVTSISSGPIHAVTGLVVPPGGGGEQYSMVNNIPTTDLNGSGTGATVNVTGLGGDSWGDPFCVPSAGRTHAHGPTITLVGGVSYETFAFFAPEAAANGFTGCGGGNPCNSSAMIAATTPMIYLGQAPYSSVNSGSCGNTSTNQDQYCALTLLGQENVASVNFGTVVKNIGLLANGQAGVGGVACLYCDEGSGYINDSTVVARVPGYTGAVWSASGGNGANGNSSQNMNTLFRGIEDYCNDSVMGQQCATASNFVHTAFICNDDWIHGYCVDDYSINNQNSMSTPAIQVDGISAPSSSAVGSGASGPMRIGCGSTQQYQELVLIGSQEPTKDIEMTCSRGNSSGNNYEAVISANFNGGAASPWTGVITPSGSGNRTSDILIKHANGGPKAAIFDQFEYNGPLNTDCSGNTTPGCWTDNTIAFWAMTNCIAGDTACTGTGVSVTTTSNQFPTKLQIPFGALAAGTATVGHLACISGSGTIGNCVTLGATNAVGVFSSSTSYQATGPITVVLDGLSATTYGDFVCVSSSVAGVAHENGPSACPANTRVGISTATNGVPSSSMPILIKF